MYLPTATELLDIWDAGSGRDHTSRALLLLERARLQPETGDPAGLAVGARDRMLLDLRERLFGSRIEALDSCPACDTRLELGFDAAGIRSDVDEPAGEELLVEIAGYRIVVRLPNSNDLMAITGCRDVQDARARLLERCITSIHGPAVASPAEGLPQAVQDGIARALGEADPQAEVELALECAACGHAWRTHFDIVDYLWAEIEQFCRRLLRDVHILARAYGWPEAEILALSPPRRRFYLGMVVNG